MEHIYQQSQFGEDWFNYKLLYEKIVKQYPSGSHFVEVGSWKGKSAAFMCVEIINSKKQIKFDCVDTWKGSVEHADYQELSSLYDIFKKNMEPFEKYYNDLKMKSIEAVKLYEDESLDFVFIDASHEYEDVKDDITHWILKVKRGGILAGDDYNGSWQGVIKAVDETLGKENIKRNGDAWIYYKN